MTNMSSLNIHLNREARQKVFLLGMIKSRYIDIGGSKILVIIQQRLIILSMMKSLQ